MPRHTELTVNSALGSLLGTMMHAMDVRSENTRVIADAPALQPDIILSTSGRSPVVVEAEYDPANTVEADATQRLGLPVTIHPRPIEAAVALRYPSELEDVDDLHTALRDTRLSYCVFTRGTRGLNRFPESGWLGGTAADLADLIRLVSVPQRAVDEAAAALQEGIEGAARLMDEVDKIRPGITKTIANILGMTNVPQTRRMACAIIANAMVFHERLAGMHEEVKPLSLLSGNGVINPQREILSAWGYILSINYYPIFYVGRDILRQLSPGDAAQLLRRLQYTAGDVTAAGIDNAHDLTGRVFQRLIVDRKYLATFYTLPASAALLARLAVAKMNGVDWSDPEAVGSLRVGDFACGTGALLSAAYEQIAARHERAGGDPAALHQVMMENVLYGCDVMPSATHITGSTLSGVRPDVAFNGSRLYTLPYGRQEDGSVRIGSLELLQTSSLTTLFNTSGQARRVKGIAEERAPYVVADIPDEGFDLVIMNPPFTRNTTREGAYAGAVTAAFAAFGASEADQRQMAERMAVLKEGTCYHGNAGVASAFAALADRKLKPGGVLALVLPLSATGGVAWRGLRQMLANDYTDLDVLSIAANGKDMSFSSDTGMGDCLIVARKAAGSEKPDPRSRFVSLQRRPAGFAHADEIAKNIVGSHDCARQIEDGPYGGDPLMVGDELMGEMAATLLDADGGAWGAVRLSDYAVAQTAYALERSRLWPPAMAEARELKTVPLNVVGKLGMYHLDIIGPPPRGPFSKAAPSRTATYPALWNHDAKNETRIVCSPDSQLRVRRGMEAKAHDVWASAGHAHLNLDFTFGSQALAVAFTERQSIGGRVWPNVIFDDERFDYAFAVWGNSTLGLLSHWWHSNRQQSSKAGMTIRSAESLPVLDFRALTGEQLRTAESIFDEFRDKELKPAYLADADPNRALLDRCVVCDLLGFDDDAYQAVRRLAEKWCAEPSVHGGKQRPRGATLVV